MAHDIQQQVSKYVKGLGIINSFDTWHGMPILFKCLWVFMCFHVYVRRNEKCRQGDEKGFPSPEEESWQDMASGVIR